MLRTSLRTTSLSMRRVVVSSVLLLACGGAQPRIDPAIAKASPTEPPAMRTVTVSPRACDEASAREGLAEHLHCAWSAVAPPRGAVIRTAMLDCGFRGRPPTPVALAGGALSIIVHRGEGDILLAEDGASLVLPRHDALVVTPSGPITLLRVGAATMVWSKTSCELVDLPGPLSSPFAADDGSIRGWVDDRATKRANDGTWSIAADDAAATTLDARAPHAIRNGLDARLDVRHEGERFRLVAQRWGFAPVVVTQTEPHIQPVSMSIAPPRHGAGPRAPAVVLRDGVRLVAGDNGSVMRRTKKLSLHVPDAARGYRELDVDVGEQRHDCEQTFDEGEHHPSRADSDFTEGAALARTVDDALWLVTHRHHAECTFVLDPPPPIEREGGERHPPPPRMWRGVTREERDEVLLAPLDETDGSTGSALRVPVTAPKDSGATWLEVGASGTNVLAVVGGFAAWIDTSKVSR